MSTKTMQLGTSPYCVVSHPMFSGSDCHDARVGMVWILAYSACALITNAVRVRGDNTEGSKMLEIALPNLSDIHETEI